MKQHFSFTLLLFLFLFCQQHDLFADEVYLKNGDRLSGKVIEDSKEAVAIETEALGKLRLEKRFVERVVRDEKIKHLKADKEDEDKKALWKREIAIGYAKSGGNTQKNNLSTSFYANRKTQDNEFTLKGSFLYASSNRKMDAQKWNGMARYAVSFWERKWYNFYKVESDHDRFANVDYRIVPSLGLGYWFNDGPTWKAMAEVAVGLERTNFRDGTKDSEEAILVPRAFFEKKLWAESSIKEDLYVYPRLEDMGVFRLHSETIFENPINDSLSLRISVIDDYNSEPARNSKKNDVQIISSLAYSF
ncbi:YdiY family protein [Candidatus Omnitrophota bacterium]